MGNYSGEGFVPPDAGWHAAGYSGGGNVKGILGSLAGRPAAVVGSGGEIREIITQLECQRLLHADLVVFGCNDIAVFLPHIDHMVSWHGDKLRDWASLRGNQFSRGYGNFEFRTHAGNMAEGADYDWSSLSPSLAISGYFSMQIAYLMGCEPITLIGCPGDNTPRFWEIEATNPAYREDGVVTQVKREMARLPDFKKRVRSLSGWTKEFFG